MNNSFFSCGVLSLATAVLSLAFSTSYAAKLDLSYEKSALEGLSYSNQPADIKKQKTDFLRHLIELKQECNRMDDRACMEYFSSKKIWDDGQTAAEIACEAGAADGCYQFGKGKLTGLRTFGISRDIKTGIEAEDQACSMNFGAACTELGKLYESAKIKPMGRGIDKKANQYWANLTLNLCEKYGDGIACLYSDYANSDHFFGHNANCHPTLDKACELGAKSACGIVASAYRIMASDTSSHYSKKQRSEYEALSRKYKTMICKDEKACTESDEKFHFWKTAQAFYKKGCELKDGDACLRIARLYRTDETHLGTPEQAGEFLLKSCEFGSGEGCELLGDAYREGTGFAASGDLALNAYKKACDALVSTACTKYAEMNPARGTSGANQGAETNLKKSCDQNDAEACRRLAELYKNSNGEKSLVLQTYVKACDLGDKTACREYVKLKRTN
jgi:hypothetical protein